MVYKFDGKKKAFLEAYEKTLGNITAACKSSGVSRQTFYNWRAEDQEFATEISHLNESTLDIAESVLKEVMIKEKNITAVIFFLKTKGKERGYVERAEVEQSSTVKITGIEGVSDDAMLKLVAAAKSVI